MQPSSLPYNHTIAGSLIFHAAETKLLDRVRKSSKDKSKMILAKFE